MTGSVRKWIFYLFESESIQQYILDGGKMAEMVGASELLEKLLEEGGPLDHALSELDLQEDRDFLFSRRGGGAFGIFFTDESRAFDFQALWRLIVPGFTPGLKFHDALEEGGDQISAFSAAEKTLKRKQQLPDYSLPEVGPLVIRASRTGRPAVGFSREPEGNRVWVDESSQSKKGDSESNSRRETRLLRGERSNLEKKFLPKIVNGAVEEKAIYRFPRNLEPDIENDPYGQAFPFKTNIPPGSAQDDSKTHTVIGIVHADGNGLGQILGMLGEELAKAEYGSGDSFATAMYQFSKGVEQATIHATKATMASVVFEHAAGDKQILPVRPLILGGDDLTLIIRADLAIDFCEVYLKEFERHAKREFARFDGPLGEILKSKGVSKMTACAGIAFIRASQPFYLGYQLCESLCRHAKNESKSLVNGGGLTPASLAFYKVKSTFIDDYADLVKREMQIVNENGDGKEEVLQCM